jgi:hypothetical protein
MILPKELNQLILQFVESPRIPDLLFQCWKEQLQYGSGYFCVKTTFQIQPAGPRGRTTFSEGWTSHLVFKITRHTFSDLEVAYKYDIEVVWRQDGNSYVDNGLSVFSKEYEEDNITFPLDFTVLGSMPRACKNAPDFFVGHVWEIEVDTSVFRNKKRKNHDHLFYGGFSFDSKEMLALIEGSGDLSV